MVILYGIIWLYLVIRINQIVYREVVNRCLYIHISIYIYIERERDTLIRIYIYTYMYLYIIYIIYIKYIIHLLKKKAPMGLNVAGSY